MAGDRFHVGWSMALDAICTIIGAMFGSPFPTCIFIGQPAFKAMGARSAYMLLSGVFVFVVAVTGATSLIFSVVPMSAGVGFLLWVGVLITAQVL
jgi:adenine/guanine/hypoxanthine permease